MFYIIETKDQLEKLKIYKGKPCFLGVIPFSNTTHSILNQACAFYYRPFHSKSGFILAINHLETFSLEQSSIIAFLSSLEAQIWMIDRKVACYYGLKDLSVMGLKMAYTMSGRTDFPELNDCNTFTHRFFEIKLNNRHDLNRFIPICKHYEKFEKYYSKLEFPDLPVGYSLYNNQLTDALYEIEKNGISIDGEIFSEKFKDFNRFPCMEGCKIYTDYNLYHSTSRPTCKANNINFLGLTKSNGTRSIIVPENDILIEFDYKSYQIKLLADLIGFSYEGDIHTELAKIYFPNDEITSQQYTASKSITFRIVFGAGLSNRSDQVKLDNVPFFKKVEELKIKLWNDIIEYDYITSPISGKRIYGITEKTQTLPYLMQCIETERNAKVMTNILEHIKNLRTKLILYTYDAFLFDYSIKDGKNVVKEIKAILEADNHETSVKIGDNYHDMENFSLY